MYERHNASTTPEYRTWRAMKSRCNNPNNKRYATYGGRGIAVEFKSFDEFFSEVGPRPSPKHTIDRIDNDGNYAKGNVKWSTSLEQCRNRRNTATFTWNGKTQTLSQWAKDLAIPYKVLSSRIYRHKWTLDKVFSTPAVPRNEVRMITWNGKTQTITEWAAEVGICRETLEARLNKPYWTVEEALTKPVLEDETITWKGKTLTYLGWEKETGIHHATIQSRVKREGWTPEEALTIPVDREHFRKAKHQLCG